MILPSPHFLKRPFQNWMRETAALIGAVFVSVDCSVPFEKVRGMDTSLQPTQKQGVRVEVMSLRTGTPDTYRIRSVRGR